MTQPTKIIRFPRRAKLHLGWTASPGSKLPVSAQVVADAENLSDVSNLGSQEIGWPWARPTNPGPVSK